MKRAIALLPLLIATTPAHAGWQWTQWGMTFPEVMAAAPHPFENGTYLHEAAGIEFEVAFEALPNLESVTLKPTGKNQCRDVQSTLARTYGTGEANNTVWRDEANGNFIWMLILDDSFFTLTYEPLPTANSAGGL